MSSNNLTLKTIATLCFTSLAVAILVASNTIATGYELSIYASTPALAWFLLSVCVIGGIWLTVYAAFAGDETGGERGHTGLVAGPLVLANLTVLLLPTLRGYFLYASPDSLAHIGRGLDIVLTKHTDSANFYPVTHILIAQLSQLCDIPTTSVGRLLPIFFSAISTMLWMYLVSRVSLPRHGQSLLALCLSSSFLLNSLHVMIYAQMLSFFPVLLVLYLRLKDSARQRLANKIPLIIALLFIPYSHPATSMIMIVLLLALELSSAFSRRLSRRSSARPLSFNLPLISTITLFTWISSFVVFGHTLQAMWTNLREPFGGPHVQTLERALEGTNTGGAVGIFLKMYGDSVICLLLAAVGSAIVIAKVVSGQKELSNLYALTAAWLITIPTELLMFAGTRLQTVGRLANLSHAIFLSPLLAGYVLHEVLRRTGKTFAIAAVSILVASVWMIGVLGVYHSPWISQPSWQITQTDIEGVEWFIQRKEAKIMFSALGYSHGIPYVILGYHSASWREDMSHSVAQMWRGASRVLPKRFGYNQTAMLGESMGENRYLLLTQRFQIATANPHLSTKGLTVIPLFIPGFQPADFVQLNQDPTVDKLYSNGGLEVWWVSVSHRDN